MNVNDYGYYITCDNKNGGDKTYCTLSLRKGYKVSIIDQIVSDNILSDSLCHEYLFKHCRNKHSAFAEFKNLKAVLD